jgi:hypothetical protein
MSNRQPSVLSVVHDLCPCLAHGRGTSAVPACSRMRLALRNTPGLEAPCPSPPARTAKTRASCALRRACEWYQTTNTCCIIRRDHDKILVIGNSTSTNRTAVRSTCKQSLQDPARNVLGQAHVNVSSLVCVLTSAQTSNASPEREPDDAV